MNISQAIGVFDSGYGGLTVARELAQALPGENIIYFGDSARCPYGPRTSKQVQEFSAEISSFLIEKGCKLIVIACNTATAASLDFLQDTLDVPV
ncbi:MAG: aspartate/glutamate racemase family protein, partial [Enterococcus sp.]|nr:aspartate/glutamate racemase family protein [Enterococcus sp.]